MIGLLSVGFLAAVNGREPQNEIQRITFSAVPGYGRGTYTGPEGQTIGCPFDELLSVEQAQFDVEISGKAPTLSSPTPDVREFLFETGAYALTNVAQMSFTPNTTDEPLRTNSTNEATLTKVQDGDDVSQPNVVHLMRPSGEVGHVFLGADKFSYSTGSGAEHPSTINDSGNFWDVIAIAGGWELTSQSVGSGGNIAGTLTGQKWGVPVTGVMSTVQQGG